MPTRAYRGLKMSVDEVKEGQEEKKEEFRVRSTPQIKIKARMGKNIVALKLRETFGFLPEAIIIEKPLNENNRIIVRALLTPEEIKKEDKRRAEHKKAREKFEAELKKGGKHGSDSDKSGPEKK